MAFSRGSVLAHQRIVQLFLFCLLFVFSLILPCVSAGQFFTNGISIIDAPSVGNPGHAGSNLDIAIEISGNGKLKPAEATDVNSQSDIHYTSLEIYLVSSITGSNYTVANSSILTKEPGSTVLHVQWQIPTCITAGDYNLTFYEGSMVSGQPFYTITPIEIPIDNPNPTGGCDPSTVPMNTPLAQPQDSSPPTQPLFNVEKARMTTLTSTSTSSSALPTFFTVTLSANGGFPFPVIPTVTVTESGSPSTVVMVSMATHTTTFTEQGQATTETVTEAWTSTTVVQDNTGFIPVNSAELTRIFPFVLSMPITIGVWLFI